MKRFLERLLKRYTFEEMRIPLGVLATDLCAGHPVTFRDHGDVFLPIRASCAYPGLFLRCTTKAACWWMAPSPWRFLQCCPPTWCHACNLRLPAGTIGSAGARATCLK